NCHALDEQPVARQQAAISGQITAVAPASAAMGRGKVTAAPRMNGGVAPSRGRSDLPILFRHARSGVPSSVASSHDITALGLTPRGRPPLPAGLKTKNSDAKASKGRRTRQRQAPRSVPRGRARASKAGATKG